MKVKDLRAILKGLPADMEVVVDTGIESSLDAKVQYYGSLVAPLRKGKTKLTKTILGYESVQSRPRKDSEAQLKLVLE